MAETGENKTTDSAEKAYAAAAESAKLASAEPIPFPAKGVRSTDSAPANVPVPVVDPIVPVEAPLVKISTPDAAPAQTTALPAELEADLALAAPRLKRLTPAKPVKAKSAKTTLAKTKPAKSAPAKSAPARSSKVRVAPKAEPVAAKRLASVKPKAPKIQTATKPTPITQSKEKFMSTKKTTDFTSGIKKAVADVQGKAKLAYAKGSAVLGEASTFTKGNVDAVVESGKILAAGLQDLSKTYVAEGKSAVDTVTADVKDLTTVKSPNDFVQLQSKIVRRNVDQALAFGSKNSEAVIKLFNDAFAPLSKRASLAVEAIKKAA